MFSVARPLAGTLKVSVRWVAEGAAPCGRKVTISVAVLAPGFCTVRYSWKVAPAYPSAKYQVVPGAVLPRLLSLSSRPLGVVRLITRSAAMRKSALTMALTVAGPLVAGVAAGVVTNPLDCDRLRTGGFVVWLRGSIETLAQRVEGTDRPWLDDDPRRDLTELYAGRAHLYESVAKLVLDVDELPAERLADLIATTLQRS